MYDKSDITGTYGTAARTPPNKSPLASDKPKLDQEPAWKSEFRRTLEDIKNMGFGAYAEEIHAKKMEELREKILASMGLTEGDLENMSPQQREQIEKMVALEIQKRLAAEGAIDDNAADKSRAADNMADQVRAAPNGLGAGMLLMQEIDPDPASQRARDTDKDA